MDQPLADRREDARVPAGSFTLRATVRGGSVVVLVDLSAGGALVQAAKPLRPGAKVHLQIVNDGRAIALVAQVVRCVVWALHPETGVVYRGALKFDGRCERFWEDPPPQSASPPLETSSRPRRRAATD